MPQHRKSPLKTTDNESIVLLDEIDGKWKSKDGTVCVDIVGIAGEYVSIHSFSSLEDGKGNARRALKELKDKFNFVAAIGIGMEPTDPSWKFWVYMKEEGLVDKLEDDEGNTV